MRLDLIQDTEHAAEAATRAATELGDYIDWLKSELNNREAEVKDLTDQLADAYAQIDAAKAGA